MSEMDNLITKLSFKVRELFLEIEKRELEKQLRAKEQECEELKKALDKYLNQEEEYILPHKTIDKVEKQC